MIITSRRIEESDLDMIMNWRMSPEVTKYMNTNPKLTIESQRKWLESVRNDGSVRYWIVEVDEIPAGLLYLTDIDYEKKKTSWGYYVGEMRLRSLELAVSMELSLYEYVFEKMEFDEIYEEVFSLNSGVIKLHQLCGCIVERIVEEEVEKEGVKYDVTHLSITKDTWQEKRSSYKFQKINLG